MTSVLKATITLLMAIITLLALFGVVYVIVSQKDKALFRIIGIIIDWCMGFVLYGLSIEKL